MVYVLRGHPIGGIDILCKWKHKIRSIYAQSIVIAVQ